MYNSFEIVEFKVEEKINSLNRTYDYRIDLFYRLTYADLVLKSPKYYLNEVVRNIDFTDLILENMTGLS